MVATKRMKCVAHNTSKLRVHTTQILPCHEQGGFAPFGMARQSGALRYGVIALDEVGYVLLAGSERRGCFQRSTEGPEAGFLADRLTLALTCGRMGRSGSLIECDY